MNHEASLGTSPEYFLITVLMSARVLNPGVLLRFSHEFVFHIFDLFEA